jgi:hypothetical protein
LPAPDEEETTIKVARENGQVNQSTGFRPEHKGFGLKVNPAAMQ